jgi:hypothetical protein
MSEDQIRKIESQLKRISDALLGDEEMGHIGVVDRLKNVEATVNEIQQERRDEKSQRKGMVWIMTTAGTIGGTIGGFIAWASGLFTQVPKP